MKLIIVVRLLNSFPYFFIFLDFETFFLEILTSQVSKLFWELQSNTHIFIFKIAIREKILEILLASILISKTST